MQQLRINSICGPVIVVRPIKIATLPVPSEMAVVVEITNADGIMMPAQRR